MHNQNLSKANKITILSLPARYLVRSSRAQALKRRGLKAKWQKRRPSYLEEAPVEEGEVRASDLRHAVPAWLLRPVLVLREALPPVSRHLRATNEDGDSLPLNFLLFNGLSGDCDRTRRSRPRRDQICNMFSPTQRQFRAASRRICHFSCHVASYPFRKIVQKNHELGSIVHLIMNF